MKTIIYSASTLMLGIALIFGSCAKDGAIGPAGKDGLNGIDGKDRKNGTNGADGGNANVRMYKFTAAPYNFATEKTFSCPSSEDSSKNSVWNTYISNGEFNYQIPGYGIGGTTFIGLILDLLLQKQTFL